MIQNIFSHQRTQKKGGGGFFYRDRKTRGEKKEVISAGEWQRRKSRKTVDSHFILLPTG